MSYYLEPHQSGPWRFALGLLAGLLLAGCLWVIWSVLDRDDPPSGTVDSPAGRSQSRRDTHPPQRTVQDSCKAMFAAQAAPLANGAPALGQWEVHIGAMNKLVTGAITLQQASAFWENTRVGAYAHLEQFQEAEGKYAARTVRCPGPQSVRGDADLRRCAAAVAARHRAIRALGTALNTWAVHVQHMDMLRDGRISPDRAEQMWLASWRAGVVEVSAYRAALSETRGLSC